MGNRQYADWEPRSKVTRKWIDALQGKTIRFSFSEGPAKGAAYDHTFGADGTVTWRESAALKRSAASETAASGSPTRYRAFQVADDVYVVSYLTKSGYTLTVALNFETEELFGFTSNGEHWHSVRGAFEVVD